MSQVRSTKLFLVDLPASPSVVTVYTVPAGRRTVLKTWRVFNVSGVASDVGLHILQASDGVDMNISYHPGTPDLTIINDDTWLVLDPGDELIIHASHGPVFSTAAGFELDLP